MPRRSPRSPRSPRSQNLRTQGMTQSSRPPMTCSLEERTLTVSFGFFKAEFFRCGGWLKNLFVLSWQVKAQRRRRRRRLERPRRRSRCWGTSDCVPVYSYARFFPFVCLMCLSFICVFSFASFLLTQITKNQSQEERKKEKEISLKHVLSFYYFFFFHTSWHHLRKTIKTSYPESPNLDFPFLLSRNPFLLPSTILLSVLINPFFFSLQSFSLSLSHFLLVSLEVWKIAHESDRLADSPLHDITIVLSPLPLATLCGPSISLVNSFWDLACCWQVHPDSTWCKKLDGSSTSLKN